VNLTWLSGLKSGNSARIVDRLVAKVAAPHQLERFSSGANF